MDTKDLEIGLQSLSKVKLNKLVDEESIPVNTVVTFLSKSQENNFFAKTSFINNFDSDSNKVQRKVKFTCENHNIIVKNAITNKAMEGVNAQVFKEVCRPRILNDNSIERSIKSRQQSSEFKLTQKNRQARQTPQNKDANPKRGKSVSGAGNNDIAAHRNLPQRKEVDQMKNGNKNDQSQLTWASIDNHLTNARARLRKQNIGDTKNTKKTSGPIKATFRQDRAKSAPESANIEPAFTERRVMVVFNSPSTDSQEKKGTEDGSEKSLVTKSTVETLSKSIPVVRASSKNVSRTTQATKPIVKPTSMTNKKSLKESDTFETKKQIRNGKNGKISSLINGGNTNMAEAKSSKAKKEALDSGVKTLQQNHQEDNALIKEFKQSALYKRLEYASNLKTSRVCGNGANNPKAKVANYKEQTSQKLLSQTSVKEQKDKANNIKQKLGFKAIEKLLPNRQSMPRYGVYAKKLSLNARPNVTIKEESVKPISLSADKPQSSVSTDKSAARDVRMGLMSKHLVQGSQLAIQGKPTRRLPVIDSVRGLSGRSVVKSIPFIPALSKTVEKCGVELPSFRTGKLSSKPEKLTAKLREEKKPNVVEIRVNGGNQSEMKSKMKEKIFELEHRKKHGKLFNNPQEKLKLNKVTNKALEIVKDEKHSQVKKSCASTVKKPNTVPKPLL